jgi:hypothetical protein
MLMLERIPFACIHASMYFGRVLLGEGGGRSYQFPSFLRVHVFLTAVAIPTDLRVMLDDEHCFRKHYVRPPHNP